MRSALVTAARGICAGAAVLVFVTVFLLFQVGEASVPVLLSLFAVGIGALVVAAGPAAVSQVFGGTLTPADENDDSSDWWLANVESALEESWNRWSDLVLFLGMATLGIGSFAVLAASPQDDPPLGLLLTGSLGITGAMIMLPFVFMNN